MEFFLCSAAIIIIVQETPALNTIKSIGVTANLAFQCFSRTSAHQQRKFLRQSIAAASSTWLPIILLTLSLSSSLSHAVPSIFFLSPARVARSLACLS